MANREKKIRDPISSRTKNWSIRKSSNVSSILKSIVHLRSKQRNRNCKFLNNRETNETNLADDLVFEKKTQILHLDVVHVGECWLEKRERRGCGGKNTKKRGDFRGPIHFPSLTVSRFTRGDLAIVKAIAKYPFPTFLIDCLAPATERMGLLSCKCSQIRLAQPSVKQRCRGKTGYHTETSKRKILPKQSGSIW